MAAKKTMAKKASTAKKPATAKKTVAAKSATKATTKKTVAKKAPEKKVEEKSKHVSEKVKKSKLNPWMLSTLILGFLVVVLAIAIGAVFLLNNAVENVTPNENNETPVVPTNNEQVELLIIEDPTCVSCQVDIFAEQVEQNLIPDLKVTKLSIETDEGKAAVAELELTQVPAYMFSDNINTREDWVELSGAFLEESFGGTNYYMLNPQYVPAKQMIEEPVILEGTVVYGDANAPVTIYEFSDYECPFCAIAEGNEELTNSFKGQNPDYIPPMPKVFEEYIETGKVKLVFYNMALESLHPQVRSAHVAALCANEQDKWIEFHHKLFEDRDAWTTTSDRNAVLKEFAKELSLDETQFNSCLDSNKYSEQVDRELAYGASVGVSGTPAFFIGKNFISGAQDYATFKSIIDAELLATE